MKHFTLNLRWLIMSLVLCVGGGTAWGEEQATTLFHESFGNNTGSARDWDNSYSVKTGIADVYSGVTAYTVANVKQGKNSTGSTLSGLNQSSQGTDASIIIGPLNVANYKNLTLKYQWKAGSTKGTYTTTASYATSSNGTYTSLTGTGNGATTFVERSYTLPEAAQVSTLYLKIVWKTSNTQAIIDEVDLSGVANGEIVELQDPEFAFSPTEITLASGATFTKPSLSYATGYNGTVLYKSSNESIATVNGNGDVTPKAAGTVQICAYAESTSTFKKVNEGDVYYTLTIEAPAAPTFSPASGSTYENSQEVSINGAGTIYYTTDGSTPTTSSTQYTAPFTITDNITVKAIVVDANGIQSEVSEASYTNTIVQQPTNITITLNNAAFGKEGTVSGQTVDTGTCTKDGVTITYNRNSGSWYVNNQAIRFYKDNELIIQAPNGYLITNIVFQGSGFRTDVSSDVQTCTSTESALSWTGSAKKVTFTRPNNASSYMTLNSVSITLVVELPDCVTDLSFTPTELSINDEGNFTTSATEDAEAGAITYSYTCNNAGLTVSSEGAYTANAAGTYEVTLTATPANATHKAVSVTQTVTVVDPDVHGTLENPYTVAEAIALIETLGSSTSDYVYVKGIVSQIDKFNDYNSTIQYWISDDGKTTVQMEVYQGKNLNNTTFSSVEDLQLGNIVTVYGQLKKYDDTPEFDKGNYIVSVEQSTKADPEIAYNPDSYTISIGETFTAPTLTNPHNLPVTYSSNKDYVATVDAATGAITLGTAAGTVTITATFAGDDEYVPGQASYTLTVANNAVQYFKKVTSMSDLVAGKEYILVATGMSKAISEENSNGSNRKSVSVAIVNDKITIRDEAVTVFTLGGTTDAWTFQANDNSKYLAVTTDGNYLEESDAVGSENKQEWTVTEDFNVVNNAFTNRTIGAVANNNNSFATYTNNSDGKEYAVLFVKMPDAFDVKITAAKMGTLYVGDGNLVVPEDVTAKTLKLDTDGTTLVASREYASGDVLPAGEAVVIYGEAGDYSFEYTTDAAKFEAVDAANLLNGSDTAVKDEEAGYSYYILGFENGVAGFYRQKGTEAKYVNSAAHKAYLKVPNTNGEVKSFYVFGGDTTTGISNVVNPTAERNVVYNLAGQRVVAPTKGLYIVNGKKVFIK